MAWNSCNRKYDENKRVYGRGKGIYNRNTCIDEEDEVCSENGRGTPCVTSYNLSRKEKR